MLLSECVVSERVAVHERIGRINRWLVQPEVRFDTVVAIIGAGSALSVLLVAACNAVAAAKVKNFGSFIFLELFAATVVVAALTSSTIGLTCRPVPSGERVRIYLLQLLPLAAILDFPEPCWLAVFLAFASVGSVHLVLFAPRSIAGWGGMVFNTNTIGSLCSVFRWPEHVINIIAGTSLIIMLVAIPIEAIWIWINHLNRQALEI